MIINLPYGETNLEIDVPEENLLCVLRTKGRPKVDDEEEAILESLKDPIGTPPLVDLVDRGDEVTVVVDDNTRACPDDVLLPPLLDEIARGGVEEEDLKILIAYGLHPHLDEEGQIDLLGEEIVKEYRVINHDPKETVRLGTSSRGVPIEVNRHVVESDFNISTGFIEPHFFAGFSGGRKSIMPGVSSQEAIYGNHGFKFIDDPKSIPGCYGENPVYLDSLEHSKAADLNFILNVLLNQEKEITKVVSGDPVKAHLEGVGLVKEETFMEVDNNADIVVTTNNGAPLDLDLYQTVKGIYHASLVAREGGVIISASECGDGVGPDSFEDLHRSSSSPQEIIETIEREEPLGVQWQNQILAELQKHHKILLKCEVDDEILKDMMLEPVDTLEEGLELAFEEVGKDADILVMPEGPMVIPNVRCGRE